MENMIMNTVIKGFGTYLNSGDKNSPDTNLKWGRHRIFIKMKAL
jgi:hypothetical protein